MDAKVLIVDDEPSVLRTVGAILERAGFSVATAENGAEAQQCLQKDRFDVGVIDLNMPDLDGFELLEWMRTCTPEVIPVVLSGTVVLEDAVAAVHRGAFDFVQKPIDDHGAFAQHIQRAVNHKALRDHNRQLLLELQQKNIELENRLGQLELAHRALQNEALAIRADLRYAMRIQHALLPKEAPFPDHVALAAYYRPAHKIGGDLYDFFPIGERHLGLYVADSSGHGISAAMLTVFLKQAVKSIEEYAPGSQISDPGAVLRTLNEMFFAESFGHDMFISMTYAVVDTQSREVRFSNAGLPPVLVRRAQGPIESLRFPAPALGLNPHVSYTNEVFALEPGDLFLLHTDGIPDARDAAGAFYGKRRLLNLTAHTEAHADTILQTFAADLEAFTVDAAPEDDATLLILAAEPQRKPYQPPPLPDAGTQAPPPSAVGAEVRTANDGGRIFISIVGPGSWRESQRVLELCHEARENRDESVIIDFSRCAHLDSTFYGVLHNLVREFDGNTSCQLVIQGLTPPLLREMSELGLTTVLTHFRPDPAPLPPSMRPVYVGEPEKAEMGHLLLWAHEALVDADPRNADRFAAVLEVLSQQVRNAQKTHPSNTTGKTPEPPPSP